MNVLLIAPIEKRNRYEFVSHPLLELGHDVLVARSARAIIRILFKEKFRPELVVAVGIGGLSLFAQLVLLLPSMPTTIKLLRLGGDPIGDLPALYSAADNGILQKILLKIKMAVRLQQLIHYDGTITVSDNLSSRVSCYRKKQGLKFVIPQYLRMPVSPHLPVPSSSRHISVLTVTNLKFPEKAEGALSLISVLIELANDVEMAQRYDSISFKIAGGGPYVSKLKSYVDKQIVPAVLSIEILGFVNSVDRLYEESTIFVYSSERDAVPNVVLEAKCKGLPIVAYRSEHTEYLVNDGVDGYIVDSNQEAQEKLKVLCSNPERVSVMGLAGQRDVLERFSFDAVKNKTSVMMTELLRMTLNIKN